MAANDQLSSGIQRVEKENKELKDQIQKLNDAVFGNNLNDKPARFQDINSKFETLYLGQNVPNPFDNSTIIPFSIPNDCHNASIVITESITGEIVKTIPVSCGEIQATVEVGSLKSGTYSYLLVIDGKIIDSRQMIVAR